MPPETTEEVPHVIQRGDEVKYQGYIFEVVAINHDRTKFDLLNSLEYTHHFNIPADKCTWVNPE